MPQRIQRKRTKGWRMPPNTIYVGRSGAQGQFLPFANPFYVGGFFRIGTPGRGGFSWCEALAGHEDESFTRIETTEQAVAWFREYRRRFPYRPEELAQIRGKNLACWCALGAPCHADVLLELANT